VVGFVSNLGVAWKWVARRQRGGTEDLKGGGVADVNRRAGVSRGWGREKEGRKSRMIAGKGEEEGIKKGQ